MLSRVAERLYWTARYLERTENTARLLNVYSHLMLDLPKGVGLSWMQLIDITGSHDLFFKRFRSATERNTLGFLLADKDNPGSILASLIMARENVRTTRDMVPSEGWESVNELYLFVRNRIARKNLRKGLYEFLSQIVIRCQQITGLLAGTMSNGPPYQFVRLGRNLERCDMTTRILDVGSATLIAPGSELERLENRLWTYLLRSVSAHQMYRQNVRRRILGKHVTNFLLHDGQFPRAVAHTLEEIQGCLERLPHNDAPLRTVARLQRLVKETSGDEVSPESLHALVDEIQLELGNIHTQIALTWFMPEVAESPEVVSGQLMSAR